MATLYFRRVSRTTRWWQRGGRTYEVWRSSGEPLEANLATLDRLLAARQSPADFWAAVESADRAMAAQDSSWVESGTGRLVAVPGKDTP